MPASWLTNRAREDSANGYATPLDRIWIKLIVALILIILLLVLFLQGQWQAPGLAQAPAGASPDNPAAAAASTATPLPPADTAAAATATLPMPSATPLPVEPTATVLPPSPTATALAPTPTPAAAAKAEPTATPQAQAAAADCPKAQPARLTVGKQGRVLANLNLRKAAGMDQPVLLVSLPGSVVDVIGGPTCGPYQNSAYLWWNVKTKDGTTGWSAEASLSKNSYFLEPVQ